MRILIVYGTTEGHTRTLAKFIADRLTKAGHAVTLADASEDEPPDPGRFDAAVLAGSVHVGRYQAALVHYARRRHAALNAMPSAFVSVSLSAAGEDEEDWAGLTACVTHFQADTEWAPRAVSHAAGAILFSEYDFFRKLVMRAIARSRGRAVTTHEDYDYTDYGALGRFVDEFVAAAQPVRA
jgi:menaquinone-dependent protoporphyrinogen oxidase